MIESSTSKKLYDTVISNGYCIGCGICAISDNSPFRIVMNERGQYEAGLDEEKIFAQTFTAYNKLCPFGSKSLDEDEIGKSLFGNICSHDSNLGYYQGTYAGFVEEGSFRE